MVGRAGSVSSSRSSYQAGPPPAAASSGSSRCAFAIVIIVGMCWLGCGVVGTLAYYQIGVLSAIAQVDAIAMAATGGISTLVFLAIGISSACCSAKRDRLREIENVVPQSVSSADSESSDVEPPPVVPPARPPPEPPIVRDPPVGEQRRYPHIGKVWWNTHFGDVGNIPPLPDTIDMDLNRSCPFSGTPEIRVGDTHMLVLIPETINGEPLTLNKLVELARHPRNDGHAIHVGRRYMDQRMPREHDNAPAGPAHWVLMEKSVLFDSRNKTHNEQRALIEQHEGYSFPTLLEAAVCILVEYVSSGKNLFGERAYTRCQERVEEEIVLAGFVSEVLEVRTRRVIKVNNLHIMSDGEVDGDNDGYIYGLAPIRRL